MLHEKLTCDKNVSKLNRNKGYTALSEKQVCLHKGECSTRIIVSHPSRLVEKQILKIGGGGNCQTGSLKTHISVCTSVT
jgi:hypothetical protein